MRHVAVTLDQLSKGGKPVLARTLSLLEAYPDDPGLAALLDEAAERKGGVVLGLTGPPGVGKSTLTNAFVNLLRERGQRVAVIAVDPSSRTSGGALLGDRTRIETDPDDDGVFVRSMAARERLGGLSDLTYPASVLMRALYDFVIVETVGVGQSEADVTDCADLIVFCVQPGGGDSLQFMKAGVMEVPDVILVTKGDMGMIAENAAGDVRGALSLTSGDRPAPEVAVVSAREGVGVVEALDMVSRRMDRSFAAGHFLNGRRQDALTWSRRKLRESVGAAGLRALNFRLNEPERVFSETVRLAGIAEKAIEELAENL